MADEKREPARVPGTRHGPGGRMGGGEKAKDFRGSLARLTGYCRTWLPAVIAAMALAMAGSILNLIGPGRVAEMTRIMTEGLMTGIDVEAVARIALLLAALYGLGWLFSIVQGQIMAAVTQRVSRSLRTDISQKFDRLPLNYFDTTSTGNILSRVTNDVDTIGQTLNQSVGTLVTACAMFLGSLIMMLRTNWVMALAAVLAAVAGFGLMMLIVSRSQGFFRQQQMELGALNGHIEETYSGHTVVKAYGGEADAKEQFRRMNRRLYDSAWKSQFLSGLMQPLMGFVGNLGYVAVCVAGAVLTLNGAIGFDVIVAFMLYVRLFTQPLSQLAQAATSLQSAAAASERVFTFLDEEELTDESGKAFLGPMFENGPTLAHRKLAELGKQGLIQGIITTNIDCLHTLAGSRNVAEIQGSFGVNKCLSCGKHCDDVQIWNQGKCPRCPDCGGLMAAFPVYEHIGLLDREVEKARSWAAYADVALIIGAEGSYGQVYYPYLRRGTKIVQRVMSREFIRHPPRRTGRAAPWARAWPGGGAGARGRRGCPGTPAPARAQCARRAGPESAPTAPARRSPLSSVRTPARPAFPRRTPL